MSVFAAPEQKETRTVGGPGVDGRHEREDKDRHHV